MRSELGDCEHLCRQSAISSETSLCPSMTSRMRVLTQVTMPLHLFEMFDPDWQADLCTVGGAFHLAAIDRFSKTYAASILVADY